MNTFEPTLMPAAAIVVFVATAVDVESVSNDLSQRDRVTFERLRFEISFRFQLIEKIANSRSVVRERHTLRLKLAKRFVPAFDDERLIGVTGTRSSCSFDGCAQREFFASTMLRVVGAD